MAVVLVVILVVVLVVILVVVLVAFYARTFDVCSIKTDKIFLVAHIVIQMME